MPPIYELSRPYFYHHLKSSQEYLRKAGKQIVDINNENSGAGLYMLLVMTFYIVLVGILIGTNFTRGGCSNQRQPERSNLMVDYYEGEEVSNRLVADDEEEERDNVVAL